MTRETVILGGLAVLGLITSLGLLGGLIHVVRVSDNQRRQSAGSSSNPDNCATHLDAAQIANIPESEGDEKNTHFFNSNTTDEDFSFPDLDGPHLLDKDRCCQTKRGYRKVKGQVLNDNQNRRCFVPDDDECFSNQTLFVGKCHSNSQGEGCIDGRCVQENRFAGLFCYLVSSKLGFPLVYTWIETPTYCSCKNSPQ